MTPLICELQKSLAQSGDGPVFVHSDLLGALRAIEPCTARNEMLKRHLTALEDAAAGRDLWFPTFNFDYCRTRLYSIAKDPSQSGPLSEYARVNWARWRTQKSRFQCSGKWARARGRNRRHNPSLRRPQPLRATRSAIWPARLLRSTTCQRDDNPSCGTCCPGTLLSL